MRSPVATVVLLTVLSTVAIAQTSRPAGKTAPGAEKIKTITVSEGTDIAITVSPDRKTILMDLQGLTYSLAVAGGEAKQITGPYDEASHPDWSSKAPLVAFQSYAGGTFHIWTMHPDGTGHKQITFGHGDDREPMISPDGKTIAFASDRAFKGSYDIWTVDLATGALKQITSSEADEFEPNWTPDGSSIVFVSGTGIAGKSIELKDLATGHQKTVASIDPTRGRLEAPSFSPNGSRLAYVQFSGEGFFMGSARLIVASVDSGSPIYTGNADDAFPFAATWLSNSALIYTGSGHILKADLAAKSETPIPFTATIESVRPQYSHKVYDFRSE